MRKLAFFGILMASGPALSWASSPDSRAPELRMPDLAPLKTQLREIASSSPYDMTDSPYPMIGVSLRKTENAQGELTYWGPFISLLEHKRALKFLQGICADLNSKGVSSCRAGEKHLTHPDELHGWHLAHYDLSLSATGAYDVLAAEAPLIDKAARDRFRSPASARTLQDKKNTKRGK